MSCKKKTILILLTILACVLIFKPLRKKLCRFVCKTVHQIEDTVTFTVNKIDRYFNSPTINNNAEKRFYFINLASSADRMESVQKQFEKNGIKIERFEAVNGYNIVIVDTTTQNKFTGTDLKANPKLWEEGKKYNVYCYADSYKDKPNEPDFVYVPGKKKYIVPSYKELSAGAIGLNCSTRILWAQIANSKDDQIAVIFEDDVKLADNFKQKIEVVFNSLPEKWDFIYLGYNENPDLDSAKEEKENKLIHLDGSYSVIRMHAYVINNKSATRLLKAQQRFTNKITDGMLDESTRSFMLNTYITEGKIAAYDEELESNINTMGEREP